LRLDSGGNDHHGANDVHAHPGSLANGRISMRITTLLITGAATAACAALGGLASTPAVQSDWYEKLRKPPYQPPRQVFPVVWPALYTNIAVVSAGTLDRLSARGADGERRAYQTALAVNLTLNTAWSWLFFNRRKLGASVLLSAGLTASSADLARRSLTVLGPRATPLALYPLWCSFATALSAGIWRRNRHTAQAD
jgi:tryptophan-rich sensory protein